MCCWKRYLALALVLCLLCLPACAAFSDVSEEAWYWREVTSMAQSGVIKGYPDGTFGPLRDVSRGEFVALAARALAADDSANMAAGEGEYWCWPALGYAENFSWLPPAWEGLDHTAENFELPITREEAVYILAGARSGWTDPEETPAIADLDAIDPALRDRVVAAYRMGVTRGLPDGSFGPKDHLSRCQAAVMIYRLMPQGVGELKAVNSWTSGDERFTQYDLTISSRSGCRDWVATVYGPAQIEQFWNCRVEVLADTPGNVRVIRPEDYNQTISPGGSVTVGLIAKGEGLSLFSHSHTPDETQPAPKPPVEASVPVGDIKPLHVEGTHLADPDGNAVQLRGVSTHGLAWFPGYVSEDAFRTLRDDWGANVVRLAMYTAEYGGYCNGGDCQALKALIDKGVKAADKLGMYVIIDWHILQDGNPAAHQAEAVEFFAEMSQKYADYDNVLYEICNEPQNSPWDSVIKPYAEAVLPAIRQNDPDAVVIVGTNTWSQDVDQVIGKGLDDENVVYAFHFYAATHKDSYRQKVKKALDGGVPVFVSECGLCDASGGGGVDTASAQAWFDLLNENGVSFVAWSLCNKNETASLIRSDCAKLSGWTEDDLTESGKLYRAAIRGE